LFKLGAFLSTFLVWVGIWLACVAAWITHVVVTIKTSAWVLLAIGAIIFPVGVIHGVGVWFGAFN